MFFEAKSTGTVIKRTYTHSLPIAPFVGVNAPMTAPVTQAVGQLYREILGETDIERFLGLHVSYKDLHGIERDGKWKKHYPQLPAIPALIAAARDNGMRAIIHYNTKDDSAKNPRVGTGLERELSALEVLWGCVPDGWQLNVKWPDPREMERYLKFDIRRANVHFIEQIGSGAYKAVGNEPKKLAQRVADYRDLASYFLFDLSGGVGKLFDPEVVLPALDAIHDLFPERVAVAGGLGPGTVEKLQPLIQRFPHLSWDAQGRLRDDDDNLDMKKVEAFLRESFEVRQKAFGL